MGDKLLAAITDQTLERIRVSIHNSSGMAVMIFTHVERNDNNLVFTRTRGGKLILRLLDSSVDCHTVEYSDGTKVIIEVV